MKPPTEGATKVARQPLVVNVSIDAQGKVTVEPDAIHVTERDQPIRWQLDQTSAGQWRLVGLCWCGDPPPPDEFDGWQNENARLSVIDRNMTRDEWRYGLLYRRTGERPNSPPRVFDPTIRNEPPIR